MQIELDGVDLQILDLMQANARISNVDLAKELSMAPSAVLERVKKLEHKKVILQYNTAIDPNTINRKLLAFIFIKTSRGWIRILKSLFPWAGCPRYRKYISLQVKIASSLKCARKILLRLCHSCERRSNAFRMFCPPVQRLYLKR